MKARAESTNPNNVSVENNTRPSEISLESVLQLLDVENLKRLLQDSNKESIESFFSLLLTNKWNVNEESLKNVDTPKSYLIELLTNGIDDNLKMNALLQCLLPNTLLGKLFKKRGMFLTPDFRRPVTYSNEVALHLSVMNIDSRKNSLLNSTRQALRDSPKDLIYDIIKLCPNLLFVFSVNLIPKPSRTMHQEFTDEIQRIISNPTQSVPNINAILALLQQDSIFHFFKANKILAAQFFTFLVNYNFNLYSVHFDNVDLAKIKNNLKKILCDDRLLDDRVKKNAIIQSLLMNGSLLALIFYHARYFAVPDIKDRMTSVGQIALVFSSLDKLEELTLLPGTLESINRCKKMSISALCDLNIGFAKLLEEHYNTFTPADGQPMQQMTSKH